MLHHVRELLRVPRELWMRLQRIFVPDDCLLHVLATHRELLLDCDGHQELGGGLTALARERTPSLLGQLQELLQNLLHLLDHELVDLYDLVHVDACGSLGVAFADGVQELLGARHDLLVLLVLEQELLEGILGEPVVIQWLLRELQLQDLFVTVEEGQLSLLLFLGLLGQLPRESANFLLDNALHPYGLCQDRQDLISGQGLAVDRGCGGALLALVHGGRRHRPRRLQRGLDLLDSSGSYRRGLSPYLSQPQSSERVRNDAGPQDPKPLALLREQSSLRGRNSRARHRWRPRSREDTEPRSRREGRG
mmetsp:Transcript_122450/g.305732  ORF Transcript_122450/g.305732 Transcript_122450/m.305732 type:complete len:307 (-) Transcript_122450:8-928(-)